MSRSATIVCVYVVWGVMFAVAPLYGIVVFLTKRPKIQFEG